MHDRLELGQLLYVLIAVGSTMTIATSLYNVFRKQADRSRPMYQVLPSFFSSISGLYMGLVWFGRVPELFNVTEGHVLFLIYAGFLATNCIFDIIIGTVTKSGYPYVNIGHLTAALGVLSTFVPGLVKYQHHMMTSALIIVFTRNMHMAWSVVHQVTHYLDIYCFSIKRQREKVE